MRGIAMSIIGATMVWVHMDHLRKFGSRYLGNLSLAACLAWLGATLLAIYLGI
jgi:hypothetical protein